MFKHCFVYKRTKQQNEVVLVRIEDEIKQRKFVSEWHKLNVNLIYTYNWSKTALQTFFKRYGTTMQQFNVLRILRGQHPNPISTRDIQERLLDKMSDTPRIVQRLMRDGLVEKSTCNQDRRLIDVNITEKGLELLANIDRDFAEIEALYSNLSEEEAQQLNALLDKLRG